ncbi:MAG: TetR/AcrR family transcriptional regulator [Actinomycetota bacterium]|nr:TetR/AcrR family transcriptional regulator [Actinomycetota bacterium]
MNTVATSTSQLPSAILAAALHAFTESGYDTASIEEICLGSGSSVGSFYHHFGSKEGVAAALYKEGIRSYQAGLLAVLDTPAKPQETVTQLVRHHFTWISDNTELARYLLQMGAAPATVAAHSSVRKQNRELLDAVRSWAQPHVESRALRFSEPAQLLAQLLGPSYFFTRAWLAGGVVINEVVVDGFATAASRAVSF